MAYYLPGSVLDPEMPWNKANRGKALAEAYGYPMQGTALSDAGMAGASPEDALKTMLSGDIQRRNQDTNAGMAAMGAASKILGSQYDYEGNLAKALAQYYGSTQVANKYANASMYGTDRMAEKEMYDLREKQRQFDETQRMTREQFGQKLPLEQAKVQNTGEHYKAMQEIARARAGQPRDMADKWARLHTSIVERLMANPNYQYALKNDLPGTMATIRAEADKMVEAQRAAYMAQNSSGGLGGSFPRETPPQTAGGYPMPGQGQQEQFIDLVPDPDRPTRGQYADALAQGMGNPLRRAELLYKLFQGRVVPWLNAPYQ